VATVAAMGGDLWSVHRQLQYRGGGKASTWSDEVLPYRRLSAGRRVRVIHMRNVGRYIVSRPALAASGFDAGSELGYLWLQSVGLFRDP
jgi:hypothetical protein